MGCNRGKHNTPNTLTSSIKKIIHFNKKQSWVKGKGIYICSNEVGIDSKKLIKAINLNNYYV